jgi:2-polyprenyl-3-methyl-5-hydroxy-6-metoxy-1,4-benzoquinol methylase
MPKRQKRISNKMPPDRKVLADNRRRQTLLAKKLRARNRGTPQGIVRHHKREASSSPDRADGYYFEHRNLTTLSDVHYIDGRSLNTHIKRLLDQRPRGKVYVLDVGAGEGNVGDEFEDWRKVFTPQGTAHSQVVYHSTTLVSNKRYKASKKPDREDIGSVIPRRTKYDVVIMHEVINYIPDKLQAICNAANALRVGGVLTISSLGLNLNVDGQIIKNGIQYQQGDIEKANFTPWFRSNNGFEFDFSEGNLAVKRTGRGELRKAVQFKKATYESSVSTFNPLANRLFVESHYVTQKSPQKRN